MQTGGTRSRAQGAEGPDLLCPGTPWWLQQMYFHLCLHHSVLGQLDNKTATGDGVPPTQDALRQGKAKGRLPEPPRWACQARFWRPALPACEPLTCRERSFPCTSKVLQDGGSSQPPIRPLSPWTKEGKREVKLHYSAPFRAYVLLGLPFRAPSFAS